MAGCTQRSEVFFSIAPALSLGQDVVDRRRPHQRVVDTEGIEAVRMPAQVAGPDAAPPDTIAPLGRGSPGLVVGLVLLRLMVGAIALPGWRQLGASGSEATAGCASWHRSTKQNHRSGETSSQPRWFDTRTGAGYWAIGLLIAEATPA